MINNRIVDNEMIFVDYKDMPQTINDSDDCYLLMVNRCITIIIVHSE
ncbi:hypothetical protein HMPREF0519_1346 [Lentilactobacillus hilgardii DSM 20176 = ATCC 8290]|uniref:Uncharacterized protein n=1 Tax=Lentilactobacillus hilgardii (strain ATCC 8290 / DSM 20176 / CCUG 30140 / JCM 1155 / KCTC 3500 / NBRC 15886 / NCIMB 8040 / NRRL B-1843 / 9) TaxID=1423757 RepID=C0XJD5_LENH9|nr:hypothetical protein HMPREF0519_1346 [Lentilactobacillus hilgardii DSM 20176 = ATCC 8290]